MNMQALETQFERDLAAKKEAAEEKGRRMDKQHRDFEAKLGKGRKKKQTAVNAKNKVLQQSKDLREKCCYDPREQCKQLPKISCRTELKESYKKMLHEKCV